MTEQDIYAEALAKWGFEAQTLMAVEEAAELQQALLHYMRGKALAVDVVDEIADMTIMCRQMANIFGSEDVDKRIQFKLERLEKRLEADNEGLH
jgi:NTP pyrophosphatase (non-canonical NTP hydrolase)